LIQPAWNRLAFGWAAFGRSRPMLRL